MNYWLPRYLIELCPGPGRQLRGRVSGARRVRVRRPDDALDAELPLHLDFDIPFDLAPLGIDRGEWDDRVCAGVV